MSKARYVIVYGVLEGGVAFGLGIAIPILLRHPSDGWVEAVVKFIFGALFFGCWVGFNAWDKLFRDPNPLPTTLLLRNETRPVSAVPVFLG